MNEHTKLPLSIIYQSNDSLTIGVRGTQIVVAHVPIVRVENGDCGAAWDKTQAIAEYIVLACNSREDLLAACGLSKKIIGSLPVTGTTLTRGENLLSCLESINAAIAKAEPIKAELEAPDDN